MRSIRDVCSAYETFRCKSRNRVARCVFCPSPGANSLILDCDKIMELRGAHGVMSDCIVFECHGTLHVAIVEFKGGSYSPRHARSQLVAGASLAMDLLDEAKHGAGHRMHLVVVAPRHRRLRQKFLCHGYVSLRGEKMRIHTAKCGTQFSQVIARAQRGGASPGAGGARRRPRRTLKYGGPSRARR